MKNLLFFLLIIATLGFAENTASSSDQKMGVDTASSANKSADVNSLFSSVSSTSLTISYSLSSKRPYVGEVIPVTVKLTPKDLASGDIEYSIQNEEGIRLFSQSPKRQVKDDAVYDTFYFVVQSPFIRLPDISATEATTRGTSQPLIGTTLSASTLTPPSSYANLIAEHFNVLQYKTTPYDSENNIVVFTAKAQRANIETFSIPNAVQQGFESKNSNPAIAQMTYYIVVPNNEKNISFTYFDLTNQRYESVNIPIVVDDDTVSTQSDLSPTDIRHTELKVIAAGVFSALLLVLFYWKRHKIFLYLLILPAVYLVSVFWPNQEICVKPGADIYLLPIEHGTVYDKTTQVSHYEAEKEVENFYKIHLEENRVGWVNKRDLCSN